MLVLRLNRRWAGDVENPSVTVFFHVSTASQTSSPFRLAFRMMFVAVFTEFSAFPFDCGYLGLEVKCRNPHSVANSEKWFNENWGQWSDLNFSGHVDLTLALRPEVPGKAVKELRRVKEAQKSRYNRNAHDCHR